MIITWILLHKHTHIILQKHTLGIIYNLIKIQR